jgi:hypothetical protein
VTKKATKKPTFVGSFGVPVFGVPLQNTEFPKTLFDDVPTSPLCAWQSPLFERLISYQQPIFKLFNPHTSVYLFNTLNDFESTVALVKV